jgi:hypothetical protein
MKIEETSHETAGPWKLECSFETYSTPFWGKALQHTTGNVEMNNSYRMSGNY